MAENIYVDFKSGVGRVMNNVKLYVKLLTKFRNETALDKLEAALAAENYEDAQGIAHTIKGIVGNLSLPKMAEECIELEMQIKAKSVKPEQMEKFKAVFDATIIEVDKVIAENG